MGVDAQMVVASPQALTEAELRRLAYETVSAFGTNRLWVQRDDKYGGPRHALTFGTEYVIDPVPAQSVFTVHLWTCYYGEGYERGDLPLILNLARWFRSKLPGCWVFYGGDSGEGLSELTLAREDQLWAHFVENQHRPYIDWDRRSLIGSDGIPGPHCTLCDERTLRYGWGPNYAAYSCPGCGWKQETRDGGQTWAEPEKVG